MPNKYEPVAKRGKANVKCAGSSYFKILQVQALHALYMQRDWENEKQAMQTGGQNLHFYVCHV